jgi:hypothetical protein
MDHTFGSMYTGTTRPDDIPINAGDEARWKVRAGMTKLLNVPIGDDATPSLLVPLVIVGIGVIYMFSNSKRKR